MQTHDVARAQAAAGCCTPVAHEQSVPGEVTDPPAVRCQQGTDQGLQPRPPAALVAPVIRPGTRRAGAGAGSGDAGESGEGPGRGRPAQKQGCWRWMDTPLSLLCALCLWPGRAGQCPSQAHKQNPWAQGECPLPEMPALLIRFLSITLYAPLCPGGAAHPSLL